jgi:SAM-dependent methyltransferase
MPNPNTAAAGFQNAEGYEKVMGRWSRRLAPLLIRFGGLSDGDRVLDVGCGTGSLLFTLPEIANIATATGIDLTEGFVEFARAHNNDPRINGANRGTGRFRGEGIMSSSRIGVGSSQTSVWESPYRNPAVADLIGHWHSETAERWMNG